jgi:hypothetical protein
LGKDLKGKELGKGICQRKDGLYFARCTQHGQSFGSYFKTAKDAKAWLKELDGSAGLASRGTDILRVNASKIADRTAEIAIQRKLLSDYMSMVEQSAMAADSELYSYILKAVTENLTFVTLKNVYGIQCERDMFYDRRRKFYFVLSGVR